MITTIKHKYPIVQLIVKPVIVQGELAKTSIAQAIEAINQMKDIDTIILGRGGGSLEDLWAFNEEIVIRAIYQSQIPVISGVGHETDFTLTDFISDIRATTPTGAAEYAVPSLNELNTLFTQYQKEMTTLTRHFIKTKQRQ